MCINNIHIILISVELYSQTDQVKIIRGEIIVSHIKIKILIKTKINIKF